MSEFAPRIDSTARIDPHARLGRNVSVGPYCVIGPNVVIGDGCTLESHVQLSGDTTVGARTTIGAFAALGGPPQSTTYRGGPTRLVVGSDCVIRESVTMNRGTEDGGGLTEVGDHGFFMAYSHVAHDCRVGHHVVFANSATLGGHCNVGDYVIMGGLTVAHQHTWIGAHAMFSGLSGVRGDVIPFALIAGVPGRHSGVNAVGMRRRGIAPESIRAVRSAYRELFLSGGPFAQRVATVEKSYGGDASVAAILAFLRAPRKRPLCPARGVAVEDEAG
jgi:UDP-N-acetylglucosamine acyltransferase